MVGALMTGSLNTNTNTGTVIQKPGQPNGQGTSKKLLVCAPSNAAVDELVLRLKQGVKTMNGSFHKINVLRLGRSDAINAAVKDVTLDELVRQRIEGDASKEKGPSDRQKMHEEAGRIKQELSEVRPMLEAARAANDREQTNTLARRLEELRRMQTSIGSRIDADKDTGNATQRESEIRRRQIQQQILDSAHVLCSTLSGAGHEMLKNLNVEFETVIIDEAAQCVELSALIPLKYGCSKCILVGDPKQLPPTVLSQSAQRFGYDQSLFVRMQQNSPKDIHLLDQQYRMHPEISMFPSAEFYEGKLADGDDMARLRHQPWHQTGLLGPYRFFDVLGSQERGRKGQSLVNYEELKVAMQLYERFKLDNPRVDLKGKIGIITPYKAQLFELRDRFASRYGPGISEEIEFNTTDAFQGRECEIIIFSCVRASPTGGIGFMTDIRRMNVGLTRAKSSLWILGDSRALVQGELWNKLIENAKARDRYTSGDILKLLSRPGAKLPPPTFNTPSVPQAPPNNSDMMEVDDVDMKDIPIRRPSSSHKEVDQSPDTYTTLERPAPTSNLSAITGINERGEPATRMSAGSIPPVIHASSRQKRSREGSPEIKQPAKKVKHSSTIRKHGIIY
jgi:senataxin